MPHTSADLTFAQSPETIARSPRFRSRNVKIVMAILAVLAVGYLAAGPYLTAYQLRTAILEQDGEALPEYVDFPALRESLKAELNAAMIDGVLDEEDANPFAALGAALAGLMIDRVIDAYVTPAGLRTLMTAPGAEVDVSNSRAAFLSTDGSVVEELDMNVDMGYRSLSRFDIVTASKEGDDHVTFVLRRRGIDWKLTEIRLPALGEP